MDFSWNDAQLQQKKAAVRFAQKELSRDVVKQDRAESFSHARWHKCATFGILGLPFAEA